MAASDDTSTWDIGVPPARATVCGPSDDDVIRGAVVFSRDRDLCPASPGGSQAPGPVA